MAQLVTTNTSQCAYTDDALNAPCTRAHDAANPATGALAGELQNLHHPVKRQEWPMGAAQMPLL
jgi:hypothetical protein